MKPGVPVVQCAAVARSTGKQCGKKAIPGGTVCRNHGGAVKRVASNAAVRAEVYSWGVQDVHEDPGEVLLRLVTQSSQRCRMYAAELEKLVEESPSLKEALIAEVWISTGHDTYKAGEYVRGLAKLEAQERDRCANFATKAIAAGLAERQVRLAEKQGELFAIGITAILDKLGLNEEQAALVPQVIEATVRELSGG